MKKLYNIDLIFFLSLLIPNLFSLIFVVFSPHESYYGTYYSIYFTFGYIFIIGLVLVLSKKIINYSVELNYIDIRRFISNRIVYILFSMVLIGISLHLYDKIEIRGYDYINDCIRSIREQWLNDGKDRGKFASSWQSAIGYIFTFLVFTIYHLVLSKKSLGKSDYFLIFISNIIIIIISYTLGARSIVLFAFIYICSVSLYLYMFNLLKGKISILLFSMIKFLAFIILITYLQIHCMNADKNFQGYLKGYNKELNVNTYHNNKTENNKIVSLSLLYANHGVYNFEYTLHQKDHHGTVLFSSIKGIIEKLKLYEFDNSKGRSYGKGMINGFGSIWYDLGSLGYFIFAVFHGLLFVLITIGLTSKNILIYFISQFSFIFMVLLNIFSPLVLASNLIFAPAFILSYITLIIIVYIKIILKETINV